MLCVPLYSVWSPEILNGSELGWISIYIFEDEELLIGLMPFYILFPLMLLSKNRPIKIILKVILFLLALLYFGYGLLATGMPIQDYSPDLGALMLLALLPELAYLYYMDMWVRYNEKNAHAENEHLTPHKK